MINKIFQDNSFYKSRNGDIDKDVSLPILPVFHSHKADFHDFKELNLNNSPKNGTGPGVQEILRLGKMKFLNPTPKKLNLQLELTPLNHY